MAHQTISGSKQSTKSKDFSTSYRL